MRQRPSLGAPEVPPDVPPEFADAYLRGYARARAEATSIAAGAGSVDAVDVPELPPSLTGFVIPEEGPALPAPRGSALPRPLLRRRAAATAPTATRSPFPSPRPGPAIPAPAQAEAVAAPVVSDAQVLDAPVAAEVVREAIPRPALAVAPVAPAPTQQPPVEPPPAAEPVQPVEAAEPQEAGRPTRTESSEPFVPWAFEPPSADDAHTPRRWQFEPPEEHVPNVALEILEAEERVPGTGWTFEPPVLDLADDTVAEVATDADADTLVGLEPVDAPLAPERHDDLVPGMRTYYRPDGAVYAEATAGTAPAAAPAWMIPMMTMSLIAALFLAVLALAR